MSKEKMIIDKPYYEDNSRISNSSIGWFLKKGPRFFRDMLDGKEEGLKASFLEKGTMIHEYLLQPDEFWSDYTVADYKIPRIKQQKDLCEAYAKERIINPLAADGELLLKAYNIAYNNQKTIAQKITDAQSIIDTYAEYISSLEKKDTLKTISFADLSMLKKIKENITKHKKANELLFDLPKTFEAHNEFHINWSVEKFNIKCKSLLDRVCFDHINKKIILIDLKTTVDVYNFKHSIEEYDYYRQIAYYGLAIQWYMQEVLNLNSVEYDFEAYIIAIGKDSNNEIRVFNMKNDSIIKEKVDLISDTFKKISEHTKLNQWDHTLEYYEGDGTEEV